MACISCFEVIFKPEIFDALKVIPKGVGGEYQLTDAINLLAHESEVYAHRFEGQRFDTGSKIGFLKATVNYALKNEEIKDEFLTYLNDVVAQKSGK